MPYVQPIQPIRAARLRGMRGLRGLGQDFPIPGIAGRLMVGGTPDPLNSLPLPSSATVVGLLPLAPAPPDISPDVLAASNQAAFAASQASGLPVGTLLNYSVKISIGFGSLLHPTRGSADIVSVVGTELASKWGIQIVNSKLPAFGPTLPGSVYSITLQVQLGRSYAQALDVKSILDGAIYNTGEASVVNSSITVEGNAVLGASAPVEIAQPSWLSQNWFWLAAAGVGGLILYKTL